MHLNVKRALLPCSFCWTAGYPADKAENEPVITSSAKNPSVRLLQVLLWRITVTLGHKYTLDVEYCLLSMINMSVWQCWPLKWFCCCCCFQVEVSFNFLEIRAMNTYPEHQVGLTHPVLLSPHISVNYPGRTIMSCPCTGCHWYRQDYLLTEATDPGPAWSCGQPYQLRPFQSLQQLNLCVSPHGETPCIFVSYMQMSTNWFTSIDAALWGDKQAVSWFSTSLQFISISFLFQHRLSSVGLLTLTGLLYAGIMFFFWRGKSSESQNKQSLTWL